jgi:hypothetical protein
MLNQKWASRWGRNDSDESGLPKNIAAHNKKRWLGRVTARLLPMRNIDTERWRG